MRYRRQQDRATCKTVIDTEQGSCPLFHLASEEQAKNLVLLLNKLTHEAEWERNTEIEWEHSTIEPEGIKYISAKEAQKRIDGGGVIALKENESILLGSGEMLVGQGNMFGEKAEDVRKDAQEVRSRAMRGVLDNIYMQSLGGVPDVQKAESVAELKKAIKETGGDIKRQVVCAPELDHVVTEGQPVRIREPEYKLTHEEIEIERRYADNSATRLERKNKYFKFIEGLQTARSYPEYEATQQAMLVYGYYS